MRERTTPTRRESLATMLFVGLGASSIVQNAHAQQVDGRARVLVAYFSRSGNTRLVAGHVRRALGADLFEIQPAQAYPEDYDATVSQAQREQATAVEPALKETVSSMDAYETIFLGFPIWGMTTPPVIRSFLARHDLAGKSIVPLITHGGYGTGQSLSVVASSAPRARLREGFTLQMDQEREILRRVTRWLGTVKGRS
jgi:flavodoxin